jgi:UDP-2,3-diacylglucosamine pyrophosphatase LpxH
VKVCDADKLVLVVSDCHLSAGRFFEGTLNPHEDFFFDDDMCDLFDHFSTGEFSQGPHGPLEVELVINGDYLDFLNVPYKGEFEDAVTEEVALAKLEAILKGHPKVMQALRRFASRPGKRITYLVGNHDADLFFPRVRERIIREWDPAGKFPSDKVKIIHDRDRITYPEGVEIRHGNQLESSNELEMDRPFVKNPRGETLLNMPWGSLYVLKIVNRLKWEREYLDKIRPVKVFMVFGILFDFWFTLRYMVFSTFFFVRARLFEISEGKWSFKKALQVLREETALFEDLERQAREILDEAPETRTLIFGHTHRPVNKVYPDGKQYINTGTWTKMIELDFRRLGNTVRRPFALLQFKDGKAMCELRQWVGEHNPHKIFNV